MTDTTIEVTEWGELDGLVTAMGEVGEQLREASSYAVGWMCRPDGFTPSPVCLLRPLAAVLELVADAFTEVGHLWADDWQRLRDGAEDAAHGLRGSDALAGARFALPKAA